MKKLLLLAAIGLGLIAPASAQINVVPQVGVSSAVVTRPTYNAVALALPPAASATDVACIAGSASKTVYVKEIQISGTAGTLVTLPVTLLRRTSVDTAGTAATTTANWANTISKMNTSFVAATATLISYSANPTINDTSPTYLKSATLTLPVTSAGTVTVPLAWSWPSNLFEERPVLRGVAEQLCINLNAVSVASGLMHVNISWTEE